MEIEWRACEAKSASASGCFPVCITEGEALSYFAINIGRGACLDMW